MTEPAAGLSQVVARGALRLRTGAGVRRVVPTPFDTELLAAVDAAAAGGVPLAIVVPLPAADTPLMLGAAAVTAEITRSWSVAVSATVVSARLSQRTRYDALQFRDALMSSVIPRARLDADGAVVPVGDPYPGAGGGRLVLTGDVTRVPGFGGALVIDGTGSAGGDITQLLRTRRALLYLTDNPFDAALADIRAAGGVVWTFDPPTLARLAGDSDAPGSADASAPPSVAAPPALLRAAGTAQRLVRAPAGDTDLDTALHQAWVALSALPAAATDADTAALRWAWGTFTTFGLVPTAPADYDRHVPRGPFTTRLADAPDHARAVAAAAARTRGGGSAWLAVAGAFTELLRAAAGAQKLPLVHSWLTDVIDTGSQGLLVTRNRAATQALTDALQASPSVPFGWQARIRVVGIRDLLLGRVPALPVHQLLLTGPLPRAFASLAAAPAAASVTVATAGGWEAARAARQTTQTLRALHQLRAETAAVSAARLGLTADGPTGEPEQVFIWRDGASPAAPPEPPTSPWEPFTADVLAALARARRGRPDDDADAAPPARPDNDGETVEVQALTVGCTDGRGLLLAPNDPVYRRAGEDVGKVAAKALVPGDTIALVDAGARRDLFDTVTAALAGVDIKYHLLTVMRDMWHQRIDAARGCGLTHREILARMQAGPDPTMITSETTISGWFNHHAAPRAAEDVTRFAAAVGDPELRRIGAAIGAALVELRRIHQKVGRRLSAQITGAHQLPAETLIDPQLQVYASDLLEAVTAHEVEDVAADLIAVPAALVGLLLDVDTFAAVQAGAPTSAR